IVMDADGCGYEQMRSLYHVLGTFDIISCLDLQGQTVWALPLTERPGGAGPADDPRLSNALQADETTILQLSSSNEDHPPIAVVVSPTHDAEGRRSGSLVGELHLSHAGLPLVPLPEQEKSVGAEVVDDRGYIIARADGDEILEPEEHAAILQDFIASHQSGTKIHDDHVVAYYPLTSLPGGVVIEQEQDQALAVPQDLQRTALIFGIGAVVVASVAAWFHARGVVMPIRKLTDASERIAAGALDSPILVTRDDEVGTLARSFETMRVRLKESREQQLRWERELEERVRQRTEELERRNRELAALNSIAATVSRSLDMETIMSASLDGVLDTMQADAGSIYLADGHGGGPSTGIQRGFLADADRACLNPPNDDCLCGQALRKGEAILVEDGSRRPGQLQATCPAQGFTSMAVVPMRAKDRPLGVLLVASRRPHQLGPPDVELLTAIGNTVGVALENALLHGELREKEEVRTQLLSRVISAQEEERKRIARELHDESAQLLATLLVEIGAAEELLPVKAKRARAILGRAKTDATRALTEMRKMILDLRPSALDDLGLVPAVQWYAQTRLEQVGEGVRVSVNGSQRRLPAAVETALFRIAQEAINNVAKHAAASNVSIRLEFSKGSVSIVVRDDGQGFDIKAVAESKDKTQGLGLLGMRERAALLGGRATIESRPGGGTRVAVEIPLEEDDGRR
ncbi:MAG: GAF domain-containing protein, partial [Dehalococcoidia bacterium]